MTHRLRNPASATPEPCFRHSGTLLPPLRNSTKSGAAHLLGQLRLLHKQAFQTTFAAKHPYFSPFTLHFSLFCCIFATDKPLFFATKHKPESCQPTPSQLSKRSVSGKAQPTNPQASGLKMSKTGTREKTSYQRPQDDKQAGRVEKTTSPEEMFQSSGI